jgi:hypothetical protein
MKTTATTAVTMTLALASLGAQDVGADAPELMWAKTWGFDDMPEKQLSELRGTVVLLEFWGTR